MVQASSVVSIAGLLVFGTLSSIASKVVYQTEGETFDGSIKNFKKPWASTALMFVAMVSSITGKLTLYYECLLAYLIWTPNRG